MDTEYIERLIKAAESALRLPEPEPVTVHTDVSGAVVYHATLINRKQCEAILAVKAHYEALIKAERAAVIAEVNKVFGDCMVAAQDDTEAIDKFNEWLDSMEPDKWDQ